MKLSNIKLIRSTLMKSVLIIISLIIYLFVPSVNQVINHATAMLSALSVDQVKVYILSFGMWAPITSFLLMIFQAIAAPLPAFIITFANASLFGWGWGALLTWVSAMSGAVLCFYLSRFFGREFVERLTSQTALKVVDEFFEKYGKHAILIARLLPFISFDIISYAAGLTGMSFWSFFIATGVGMLPATLVYSYVGGMLTGGTKLFVFGLFTLFALSAFVFLLKKVWDDNRNNSRS